MIAVLVRIAGILMSKLPLERIVAYLLSAALDKLLKEPARADSFEDWKNRAAKIAQAATLFVAIVDDLKVTEAEVVQARAAMKEVLDAWGKGEKTPASFQP